MANWASTSYRIEGNESDLQEMFNLCKAFVNDERPVMEENASKEWEGNIVLALGIDKGSSCLLGFIQDFSLDDGVLSIEAEEAWGATDFRHLIEAHYDNMKVYFILEEEGGEVYATNDKDGRFFDYRFLVDSSVDGADEWEYFSTKEQALSYIAKKMDVAEITEEEIDAWNEEHEEDDDNYINFHEYSLVD